MSVKSGEKVAADFVEQANHPEHVDSESHADPTFAKRTLRKIDTHLLPILAILYSISLIDRVNISNAYVAGMAVDLQLTTGIRYSLATLIFFVPYIILEFPSNIALRALGAARWITLIVVAWGAVMIGMGFVKTWWQLVICRALLGCLEAGFFPACAYIISTWYLRREIQKRMTGFYVLSIMVAGFSSALAGGISEMKGLANLNGWRWIFILLGIATVLAGIAAWKFVQDFPDKNTFLTEKETRWALDRINADRADAEYDHWTGKKLVGYLMDLHLWSFAVMFGAATTTTYAFAYFLPIILMQGMGYSARDAQLLVAPPYVFAAIFSFALAVVSDAKRLRAPILVFQSLFAIIGLCLTAFHTNNAVRYTGVFFGIAGSSANVPGVLGYLQNNIAGFTKRSFANALAIGGGGIGGIIASTVFRSQDAPGYRPGLWVTIGSQLLIILICGINSTYYYIRNKAAREGRGQPIEGRPGFFYTY